MADDWRRHIDYVLEDDDTPYGGTAFYGETLGDFLDDVFFGMGATHDDNDEINCYTINEALKQCGIKPINFKGGVDNG